MTLKLNGGIFRSHMKEPAIAGPVVKARRLLGPILCQIVVAGLLLAHIAEGVMIKSGRYAVAIQTDCLPDDLDPGNVVPRRRTLDGFAFEPGCVEGVALQSLETVTVLNVTTRHSDYHVVILDPVRQRVLVTGGRLFPEDTEVRCDGATVGGSLLKVGWIGVGLRLEMSIGRQRITTSRVQVVTIESVPPQPPSP